MEGRARKYSAMKSPERTKIWVEPHSKNHSQLQQGKKVPVVYYLCRNRHLEHPHFIEVPLSSNDGLYLRDVINRLNVLRGKGMAALYSWSCKRSYKNGFVWHDLSDDDLVLPAHGNEYILKGSELLDQSPPDRQQQNLSNNTKNETLKQPQIESPSSRGTQDGCSSSSSSPPPIRDETKPPAPATAPPPQSPARPPPPPQSPPASISRSHSRSHSTGNAPSSTTSSPGQTEYRVVKQTVGQDASTQTEERRYRRSYDATQRTPRPNNRSPEIVAESPLPSTSSKIDTLESLIRAEASKRNSFRIMEEELYVPIGENMKPGNLLMQLITCGSISVKDHRSFGFIPTYRPRFTQIGFPSPVFYTNRDLDRISESTRAVGLRVEESEYFSGSLIETKRNNNNTNNNNSKEEGVKVGPALKRSNSFEEDRTYKTTPDSKMESEIVPDSVSTRCLPQTIKMISCKQPRGEPVKSPKNSFVGPECSKSPLSSKGASNRLTGDSSVIGSNSIRLESFKADKEKVIKIEERLASGARVVIQSTALCDESDCSSESL